VTAPNTPLAREHRILVVAADPQSTSSELLEEEAQLISRSFDQTKGARPALDTVKTSDRETLASSISTFRPSIVHFTGHGSPSGRILYEDSSGWIRNVTGLSLARTLLRSERRPDCVILNGCRVSREKNLLQYVADNIISVYPKNGGVDITPVVTRAIYREISAGHDFAEAFDSLKLNLVDAGLKAITHAQLYPGEQLPHDVRMRIMSVHEPSGPVALFESQPSFGVRGKNLSDILSYGPAPVKASKPLEENAKHKEGPRLYRVWFGTNRGPVDANDFGKGFGGERSEKVYYGHCDVSIPKYHTIGSVGDPWWKRFPAFWRNNHLAVQNISILPIIDYRTSLQAIFGNLPDVDKVLLIFIHGYNVNFEQAVIRAAQLGFDLGVRGATGLFSWPSKGKVASYAADIAAIEASEGVLREYVVQMANNTGARAVHLIAHSMGNRGLLRAFTNVVSEIASALTVPLSQLILAAPDVDVDLFKQLAVSYGAVAQRTTMYVSSRDKALYSSGILHDFPRAGYTPPVTVVKGIDTVEVSNIDLTFLGHGYIAEAQRVLQDMKTLIESNLDPRQRFGLEKLQNVDMNVYWRMRG
jgi:esterase/lipase superfamily enzyme